MSNDSFFTQEHAPRQERAQSVGVSERTPYKHLLLNYLLGREVAVSTSPRFADWNLHIIDLCAGDGVVGDNQEWARSCSPGLIAFHAAWAAERNKRVHVWSHEINTHAYSQLLRSLDANMPSLGYTKATDGGDWWNYRNGVRDCGGVQYHLFNTDSSRQEFPSIGDKDLVFVLNDPNNISKWAANGAVIRRMVARGAFVTTMHTMGCNVGGLLRLDYDRRMEWNDYIDEVVTTYDRKRQACLLASLDGDGSKWGYMVTYPSKWVSKLRTDIEKAFAGYGKPIRIGRHTESEFESILDHLILTKAERETGAGRRRCA